MRVLLLIVAALGLVACDRKRDDVRADLPPSCPAGAGVEIRVVERKVYVPIPSSLTQRAPIAEGPLAQCPQVAGDRRKELEKVNSRLQQIEAIQGTEVRP